MPNSFSTLNIKSHYDTDEDDVLTEFYRPILNSAISYKRAVGYFSESVFKSCAIELAEFINNSGTIQIIVGSFVSVSDLEDFDTSIKSEAEKLIIKQRLLEVLIKLSNEDPESVKIIGDLVSSGVAEIRIARRRSGIYHEKYGIFEDINGEKIAFIGSNNETGQAASINENHESFSAYDSRDPYVYIKYGKRLETKFDNLWAGNAINTEILALDTEIIEFLKNFTYTPRSIPTSIKPEKFTQLPKIELKKSLRPYQSEALNQWKLNNWQGILAMATGTGKTLTAIEAVLKFKSKVQGGFVIVVVPYQNLALQWINALRDSNLETVPAFDSYSSWYELLKNKICAAQLDKVSSACIVAVIDTFKSARFQELLGLFSSTQEKNHMIIVDECHHFNSPSHLESLPQSFRFRLGLSATPYDQFSEKYLDSYFGKVVYEFGLGDAIKGGFLVPYYYYVIENKLNEDETAVFEEITYKIIQRIGGDEGFTPENLAKVQPLLLARARIVGACKDKANNLKKYLIDHGKQNYSLFYCGDGSSEDDEGNNKRQVEQVSSLLHDLGWNVARVTASESLNEREKLLDGLTNKSLDAIVSIRVLDEGIDIPACQTAYLLASQRSERQGIQRRGRVLRKSPETGKQHSKIVDFLVVGGTSNSNCINSLAKKELVRAWTFANDAINKDEAHLRIKEIAEKIGCSIGEEDE